MDYQEKLRLAKEALDSGSYDRETIEYIFPELKKESENEDERIKNFLISKMKEVGNVWKEYSSKDIIAWLEKQGDINKRIQEEIDKQTKQQWKPEKQGDNVSGECNDTALEEQLKIWFEKGKCSGRDEVIFHPENFGLQKQGKQKPQGKPALEVWKDMRLEVYQQASGNRHEPNYSDDSTKMFSLTDIDEIFEIVAEKQGEQNTNEIHPIFRVGDYIKNKKTRDKVVIEQLNVESEVYYYTSYDGAAVIHSDFPFSKQDEWELIGQKIVEQKSAWSEEDEPQKELAETYLAVFDEKFPILPTLKGKQLADYKNFLNKCQQILGLKYWSLRPLQAKLFEKLSLLWAAWGAEHLKGLGQTNGNTDNEKQEWSEEDDIEISVLINALGELKTYGGDFSKQKNWLKSLKERYTWRPSDEQMKALWDSIPENVKEISEREMLLDSLYQDLKKLRKE